MTRRVLSVLAGVMIVLGVAACKESKQITVTAGPSVADSAEQVLFVAHYFLTTRGIQRGDDRLVPSDACVPRERAGPLSEKCR